MQRIVVLGNAGSGKSTFSRILGEYLSIPVVYLDKLYWGPNWSKPVPEDFRQRVEGAISGTSWICEGNYHRHSFDLRLPRADLVIWMDTARAVCMKRVAIRSFLNKPRADMPVGCRERIDAEFFAFLRYVWTFDRDVRPKIERERLLQAPHVPVIRLSNKGSIADFMTRIEKSVA
ncbi:AAA family ATPase [Ochrobactrum sp. SFR4]|uniref:AAA family ATPase n=1 Tax=Ochrobactrum sp. SFR4 TaxID=2717368 RepID=UPI000EFB6570|nr:AAA family ATPase [Ochrobactrum sp. SFR4]MBX8826853.1 AAA family ATPase [Ochrobactrum sp. SFR4]